ncbi:helix-turn-helix domain-containing protein [Escherichia coli]|uniref:helix-turn-helix domain-containing protein n=1 Tax=Escherichia coli TaxID=562 RepID=UPI00175AE1E2|nr:helix-turn-helix domain-containing protein [Escherichia coli]EKY1490192.1 helix-turn-helix domain-containing protein [Escherichia coli]EKY1652245.1 helix-turn-helix domain-containing protein [Escherichia coli]MCU6289145.1 helix-turn-helix domain-containing protein [Escherichia coli]MDF7111829.1 helix-turn-helix domain-containing protein [Escherichia coli]MDP4401241.1 helix-turn-helix domain-containing protein [Escherichia coli]
MNDSELMTVNEVAALFGVTRRTIFRWMNKIKGWHVPVSPIGSRIKFIRSEILEFYKNKGARHQ